jgi:prepilin-type N-terminal cleavage/methylation domain-containing protein
MRIPGPYGFTLLEIVVVLAIVGMVAAGRAQLGRSMA